MKKYFTEIEAGLFTFDINQFMNIQNDIMKKYKLSDEFDFSTLDKYIGQINEELQEVLTSKDKHERVEEIIDALMYMGSTASYLLNSDTMEIEKYIVMINNYDVSLDDFIKDLFIKITTLRRLFPERKWHKSHFDHRTKLYEMECIKKEKVVLDILDSMIRSTIIYLLTNYDNKYVSDILLNKQDFIKSL